MTSIAELPEVMLRSPDTTWDRPKWELLPNDGNHDEVIDEVLYETTAPACRNWIVRPARRDALVCSRPDGTLGDWAQSALVGPDKALASPTLSIHAPVGVVCADTPDTSI